MATTLNIRCDSCGAEHDLEPPSWVVSSGRPFRFRCSACGHSQMVEPPTAIELPADSPLAPETPARPANSARPATVKSSAPRGPSPEDSHVYLRQDGKVYLVKDWATLQRWIMERRVGRDDEVSEGGTLWDAIGERPELGSFFRAIEQLEALEAAAHGDTGLPSAATPMLASRRGRGATGLARLDDDTEGVPIGLPPLPTEDLDGSDPQRLDVSDEAPPSRLTPAHMGRQAAGPTVPVPVPADPEPAPPEPPEPAIDESAVVLTPPTPPDALLIEDEAPLLGAAAADLLTPRGATATVTDAPEPESFYEPPTAPSPTDPVDLLAVTAGGDAEDLDLDDPFGAYERPAAPTLPPAGPPPAHRMALALWIAAISVIAIVLALVGWGFATGRLGQALPAPAPVAPVAPVAAPIVLPPPPIAIPEFDTGTGGDAPAQAPIDLELTAPDDALPDAAPASADPPEAPTPPQPAAPAASPVEPTPARVEAPEAPVVRAAPSVRDLNRRGIAELDGRDYAAALETFQSALRRAPNDAQAQFGAGYALVELGRTSEAKSLLCAASGQRASAFAGEADIVLRRLGATCP